MLLKMRGARATAALLLIIGVGLAGCELGLHQYRQATSGGCDPWQAGCVAIIDFAGPGPIQVTRSDVDRGRIVEDAEDAPYRECVGLALACQGRVIGDVLWDRYAMVLLTAEPGLEPAAVQPSVPVAATPPSSSLMPPPGRTALPEDWR
jgi:hypothetical protein